MLRRWSLTGLASVCLLWSGCADPVPVADSGAASPAAAPAAATSEPAPAAPASATPTPAAPAATSTGATSSPDSGFGAPALPDNGSATPPAIGGGALQTSSGDPFGAGGPPSDTRGADPFAGAAPPPGAEPPASPPPNTERTPAGVGVGAKGRSLDKYNSGVQQVIAEPAKSLFAARERLVFNVQIPQALQLYEATTGFAPRSHNEFMTEVIQANNIRLPELRPNQRYVYDPQRKELLVERPAQ